MCRQGSQFLQTAQARCLGCRSKLISKDNSILRERIMKRHPQLAWKQPDSHQPGCLGPALCSPSRHHAALPGGLLSPPPIFPWRALSPRPRFSPLWW